MPHDLKHTYATRKDVRLHPASDPSNYGSMWYAMIGHRAIALLYSDQMGDSEEVTRIIDNALAKLNAETEAYLATI